ncbi:MAG: hypothetical protein PHU94_03075 [Bacilli bacterium]|nr:hypothetical protein [Bacilli bacterium]
MIEWIKALLKNNKLVTFSLVIALFCIACHLIKGEDNFFSPCAIVSYVIFFIALLFSFSIFTDYKAKEHTDHIISKYSKALDEISKTHTTVERFKRKDISNEDRTVGSQDGIGRYTLSGEKDDNATDNISG